MTPSERKAVKAGKKQRIQKLLKGLANIRPEPVKVDFNFALTVRTARRTKCEDQGEQSCFRPS